MMKGTLLLASMVLGLLVCGVAWAGEVASVDADVTSPKVTRTVPVPRMTCVDPAAKVSAFFSEDMKASSVNDATVRLYRKGSATQVPSSVRYGALRVHAIIDPLETLEGNATYRVVVGTHVEDLAGNRLDQDGARDGLQPKVWAFTTSPAVSLDCQRAATRETLRDALAAATACAADHDGSYADCVTAAQLRAYGFEPIANVTINGMNGNDFDWSAAMQHSGGGSAYTIATFGDYAGSSVWAPRGTGAPALPDRTAEWEVLAKSEVRNAVAAATLYSAENNGSYTGLTVDQLVANGFKPSPNVTTTVTPVQMGTEVLIQSAHDYGGRAYLFDSAYGTIEPVAR